MPRSEMSRDVRRIAAIAAVAPLVLAAIACQPEGTSPPSEAASESPAVPVPTPTPTFEEYRAYAAPYEFNEDWFSYNIPIWRNVLEPFVGRPDLRYLEIGVYEGRSFFWALENVLTHPSSRLTGIDIKSWPLLEPNIERSGHADRIDLIIGDSKEELRKLPLESFDIIYIDGSHKASNVLADAVLSWQLLKEGGILIFDDYAWDAETQVAKRGVTPPQLLPALAIDGFVAANRYELEIVERGYQIFLKKRPNPCVVAGVDWPCSPFGPYLFDWSAMQLVSAEDPTRAVEITEGDSALLQAVLRGDANEIETRREDVAALEERLGVDSELRVP